MPRRLRSSPLRRELRIVYLHVGGGVMEGWRDEPQGTDQMSLVCYLDDSGNEDDPIVTLAGYIAPAGDWLNFEVHARELFNAHKLPYLHTMDLHQRKREFKGWTRKQTAQFANVFYRILDQHTYAGFEFSVLKSTFEANKSVYNVERQSSPLGFCLHGIVHQLVNDEGVKAVLAPPDVNLSFVVESGNRNEGDIRRRFNSIQKQDPERFGSISFVPKKERIALQAADFFAYFCRRLRMRNPADKGYEHEVEFFEIAKGRMLHRQFLATDFKV